jgi:creatinine amidohydrolase/Fe(II)-dependent formamide hydrolase-like protein
MRIAIICGNFISASTLLSMVADVADSVRRSGISALVLVNGHGGNYALSNLVQETNARGNQMALSRPGKTGRRLDRPRI